MYAIVHTDGIAVVKAFYVNKSKAEAMRCAMDYALNSGVIDNDDQELVDLVKSEFPDSMVIYNDLPNENRVTLCRVLEYMDIK